MPENDFLMHYGRSARNGAPGRGSGRYAWGSKNNARGSSESKPKPTNNVSKMTDEELRNRINRLNMEEQYANMLARKKERETSTFRKTMSNALSTLGNKLTGAMIDAFVKKVTSQKDKSTVYAEYRNADLKNLDDDTIHSLADLYRDSMAISRGRKEAAEAAASINAAETAMKEDLKPLAPSKSSKQDKKSRWDDSLW